MCSQKRNWAVTVPIPTFMFLSAIYIFPRSVCIIFCRKIGEIVRIYKSLTAYECGNWDWGRAVPFLGINKSTCLCSLQCIYFCSVSSCSALTSLLGSHFRLDQVSLSTYEDILGLKRKRKISWISSTSAKFHKFSWRETFHSRKFLENHSTLSKILFPAKSAKISGIQFSKTVSLFHMLLTTFAFFVISLRKVNNLLIFALFCKFLKRSHALSVKWTSYYALYSGGHKCNSLWAVSLSSGSYADIA